MFKIEKIDNLDSKTIKEWKKLWEVCPNRNYFNSVEWFQNYTITFSIKKYIILKGYDNKELQFILPLVQISKNTFTCIGGRYLDKVSLLYNGEIKTIINEIKKYAIKTKKSIILSECDFSIDCIDNENLIIEFASDNPYVELNQDLNLIVKKKEKRYIEGILRKNESLNFKIIIGKNIQNYIENIFDIESRSNKIKRKKALFRNDNVKDLFRNIAKTDYGMLCILCYNEIPIAHMFGLIASPKKFMAYHMAFDQVYGRLQPGKLVIYYLLNYFKKIKYDIFDFSRGNSLLKKHFSIYSSKNYNIYINPNIFLKFRFICRKKIIKIKALIKRYYKKTNSIKKIEININ